LKGAWWWNKEVKKKAKEKNDAYAAFINSRMGEEKEIRRIGHNESKNVAKNVIAGPKSMAFDKLYQNWRPRKVRRRSLS